jgi:outer membrane protein OmpA-like peptidoglycan-associated protein
MNKTTKIILITGVSILSITAATVLYFKFFRKKTIDEAAKDAFDNLLFEYGKATIKPISFPFLDELSTALIDNPTFSIQIVGHTDNKGTEQYNLKLSQDRANEVMMYLITKGVAKERIEAIGKGMTEPIADNNTEEGRATNRRVEFIINKN